MLILNACQAFKMYAYSLYVVSLSAVKQIFLALLFDFFAAVFCTLYNFNNTIIVKGCETSFYFKKRKNRMDYNLLTKYKCTWPN